MGWKKCRKATKRELKEIRRSTEFRDELRRKFLAGRCAQCFGCMTLLKERPTVTPRTPSHLWLDV